MSIRSECKGFHYDLQKLARLSSIVEVADRREPGTVSDNISQEHGIKR